MVLWRSVLKAAWAADPACAGGLVTGVCCAVGSGQRVVRLSCLLWVGCWVTRLSGVESGLFGSAWPVLTRVGWVRLRQQLQQQRSAVHACMATGVLAMLDRLSVHVLGMGMAAMISAPLGFVMGCLHHSCL